VPTVQPPGPSATPGPTTPTTGLISIRQALDKSLLHLVRSSFSGSYGRHLLSAVRLLEKLHLIGTVVAPGDWLIIKYLEKGKPGGTRPRQWASFDYISILCGLATTFEDWECVSLAVLSGAFLLRISEALTVRRTTSGAIYFRGSKSRAGEHTIECGPLAQRWLDFMYRWRRAHGRSADEPCFPSTDRLQRQFQELTKGSDLRELRWHAFRRFGAAQLFSSGLRLSLLQVYGGWHSSREAARYAHAPSSWRFLAKADAKTPSLSGTTVNAVAGEWHSRALWSTWVRRELQGSDAGPRGAPKPVDRKRTRSAPARDDIDAEASGSD
jgi:hypothetical protein